MSVVSAGTQILVALMALISVLLPAWWGLRRRLDNQDNKLDEIHVLTNSNLSKANARLDEALNEIKALQAMVIELKIGSGRRT